MMIVAQPAMVRTRPPEPLLDHEIRLRAYSLYEDRGKQPGRALDDWLQAEIEIWTRILASGDFWKMPH